MKDSFSRNSQFSIFKSGRVTKVKQYNRYGSNITKKKIFGFETSSSSLNNKDFREKKFKPLDYIKLRTLLKDYVYSIISSEDNGLLIKADLKVLIKPIKCNLLNKDRENADQENDFIEYIDESGKPHAKM